MELEYDQADEFLDWVAWQQRKIYPLRSTHFYSRQNLDENLALDKEYEGKVKRVDREAYEIFKKPTTLRR